MADLRDEAKGLYHAGRYKEACARYHILAEQGDIQAQLMLGGMLAEGLGTERDSAESEKWYKCAAQNGAPEAQHHLGYLSYQSQDYSSAHNWYREAASQGYLPALWRLAWLYRQGKGVPLDNSRAYALFDQAAKAGHVFSKRDLALMLLRGHRGFLEVFRGLALLVRCILDGIQVVWKSDSNEKMKV